MEGEREYRERKRVRTGQLSGQITSQHSVPRTAEGDSDAGDADWGGFGSVGRGAGAEEADMTNGRRCGGGLGNEGGATGGERGGGGGSRCRRGGGGGGARRSRRGVEQGRGGGGSRSRGGGRGWRSGARGKGGRPRAGGARGAARGGESGCGRRRGVVVAGIEVVGVMVEEGWRDRAVEAAGERTLETGLGAASRMPTTRVHQAPPTRTTPNPCPHHATPTPCPARGRRGGARGCEARGARQARVSCGEERRRRRRRRGRSGMVQTAEEAGPRGRRGRVVGRQAATKEWRGEAMVQRGQARRASRSTEPHAWPAHPRPRSGGAKPWCSVDRPDERAARLSPTLGLPTHDPPRAHSALSGSIQART